MARSIGHRVTALDNLGKFFWPKDVTGALTLSRAQLDALVLGLPW